MTPGREDDEYTLVHATRHGHRATEKKEPTPEPAATPPTETSPPKLDPVPTAGPCPHPSGAQYPAVHGSCVRGTHATRLDQVPLSRVSLDSVERINWNEENDAAKEKINAEIVFTDLKSPP